MYIGMPSSARRRRFFSHLEVKRLTQFLESKNERVFKYLSPHGEVPKFSDLEWRYCYDSSLQPVIRTSQQGLVQMCNDNLRVIDESLIHRRQWVWMSLENLSASAFEGRSTNRFAMSAVGPSNLQICPHIKLVEKITVGDFLQKGRCSGCRTEFSLGFKHFESRGYAFYVTIWKDLGNEPYKTMMQSFESDKRHDSRTHELTYLAAHETSCAQDDAENRI
ncbi:predicted protein [Sclerotinia sclerotiorum 1980 UF-70]|uniref:Uncharacterized protein n=1 Tax=Sclerotinia sclerotiorum (strain ATCC 18683 / 1980 / Ss-1) TaxID=665079 RepID=A7EKH2_SCLS1|nr:predicted protein [Sclerotinia sclerotiorum 1980 UF-70]EDO03338.1 predicted protein [Sclerotinia sclerotiorum 1980 UF-70]